MYNLLVSGDAKAWDDGEFVLETDRCLTHTHDQLRARLASLEAAAVAELTNIPALFAYEKQVGAAARVGWVTDIEKVSRRARLTFKFDPAEAPVPPEKIESLRRPLQIEESELNRTHWAVKSVDLFHVLRNAAGLTAAARANRGEYKFARQTLLRASDMLKALGHSDLDRFLLELGIGGLQAGRDKGSRADRMHGVIEHVLNHPGVRTAEGEDVALALVREAARTDPSYPTPDERYGMDRATRDGFWLSLKRDGYKFAVGQIVADVESEVATPPYAVLRAQSNQPIAPAGSAMPKLRSNPLQGKQKVFLVHGRDDGAKHEVARFLERLDLESVILHERPNCGRTLISKFQEESADIHFAVVLMTPDDVGGLLGSDQQPRARQNVIFELGFFIGKLGAGRVCALSSGAIEKPSDFEGVVYVPFGQGAAWKIDLARELRHAGVVFDANKVL